MLDLTTKNNYFCENVKNQVVWTRDKEARSRELKTSGGVVLNRRDTKRTSKEGIMDRWDNAGLGETRDNEL